MRRSPAIHKTVVLTIVVLVLLALGVLPLLSSARSRTVMATVSISNNSSREIHHVYLQAEDGAPLSEDQLHGSIIAPGASQTLSSIACTGQSTKVITEDKDGCFLYKTVTCDGDTTWTITNEATPDCGN